MATDTQRTHTLPDGSFPIPDVAHLKKAIKAFGRANPSKRGKVKAHIKSRARALGREDLIPDDWKSGSSDSNKSKKTTEGSSRGQTYEFATDHSSRTHRGLERNPGKQNWVDKAGGLPSYIERIAKHLHADQGYSISRAIATAVNVVKKMCRTGDLNYPGKQSVNPKSRAEACNAVRQWEQKKAKSRVTTTEVSGRKLTDGELITLMLTEVNKSPFELAQRAPGASGSNQAFDERKYARNQATGQFAEKFTPAELLAGRRIVEANIVNLGVGQTYKLPGRVGWVKRTSAGYMIQGPAGIRLTTEVLSEAIEFAAGLIAGKLRELGGEKNV